MVVLICGSRNFDDPAQIASRIEDLPIDTLVIHGGAKGADIIAGAYSESRGLPVKVFPAKWSSFGKRAGFVRNSAMLEQGQPDLVIAFVRNPANSPGTANMVLQALCAGVEVEVHIAFNMGG